MRIKLDKLDILFSKVVRMRAIADTGGCEYCGTQKYPITKEDGTEFPAWKQLHCSHYVGRRHRGTRWDLDNASGICFPCHIRLGGLPFVHTEWFKKRLGSKKFDELNIRAETIAKNIDKEALKASLKEWEAHLESE